MTTTSRLEACIVDSTQAETQQMSVATLFAVTSLHTEYTIRSTYGTSSTIEVKRRFTEFETVHTLFATEWLDADGAPVLPEAFPVPKLYLHTEYELNERRKALQLYLRGVVASVAQDSEPPKPLLEFLGMLHVGGDASAAPGAADVDAAVSADISDGARGGDSGGENDGGENDGEGGEQSTSGGAAAVRGDAEGSRDDADAK